MFQISNDDVVSPPPKFSSLPSRFLLSTIYLAFSSTSNHLVMSDITPNSSPKPTIGRSPGSIRFDPQTKSSTSIPSSPNHNSFPNNPGPSSLRRLASPRQDQNGFDIDSESQALLGGNEDKGRWGFRPVVWIGVLLVVGGVVGAGGWMLSRGEGGARWPGGPH